MGKCYPITRFLDFGGISNFYSQPNSLMELAINKTVPWVSPVSTVSFRCAYNGRYGSWPITGSDSRHGTEEANWAGKAAALAFRQCVDLFSESRSQAAFAVYQGMASAMPQGRLFPSGL